jgi:excisionase family DNA binding protein
MDCSGATHCAASKKSTIDCLYILTYFCYVCCAFEAIRVFFMMLEEPRVKTANFLTPKEAAAYLSVNPRTFYNWLKIKKKGIPCRRLGPNCIRIPKAKFIAWANAETGD